MLSCDSKYVTHFSYLYRPVIKQLVKRALLYQYVYIMNINHGLVIEYKQISSTDRDRITYKNKKNFANECQICIQLLYSATKYKL